MIKGHTFKSGCLPGCKDDHSKFLCVQWVDDSRQCDKFEFEHLPDPTTITFDGSKGIVIEECPRCFRQKWLGACNDGSKMCQSCFHRLNGLGPLPSDSM